jgi:hypothetical protein
VYRAAILIPCGAIQTNMRMGKVEELRRMICLDSMDAMLVMTSMMAGLRLNHLASRHHHGMILKNLKSNGSV